MKKWLLAMLLVALMLLALLPMTALAAESDEEAVAPAAGLDEAELMSGTVTVTVYAGEHGSFGDKKSVTVSVPCPSEELYYDGKKFGDREFCQHPELNGTVYTADSLGLTADAGWVFAGWGDEFGIVSANEICIKTILDGNNICLFAFWKEAPSAGTPDPEPTFTVTYKFKTATGNSCGEVPETRDGVAADAVYDAQKVKDGISYLKGTVTVDNYGNAEVIYNIDENNDNTADKDQITVTYEAHGAGGRIENAGPGIVDLEAAAPAEAGKVKGMAAVAAKAVVAEDGWYFKGWTLSVNSDKAAVYADEHAVDMTAAVLTGKVCVTGGFAYTLTATFEEGFPYDVIHYYIPVAGDPVTEIETKTVERKLVDGVAPKTSYTSRPEYDGVAYIQRETVEGNDASIDFNAPKPKVEVFYDIDANGDGIPDKNQFFVKYVAGAGGKLIDGDAAEGVTMIERKFTYTAGVFAPEANVTLLPDDHYTADGWDLTEADKVAGGTITFTAQFKLEEHKLTIHYRSVNGEDMVDAYEKTLKYGETVLVESPVISNYTADHAAREVTMGSEDIVLYVTYSFNTPARDPILPAEPGPSGPVEENGEETDLPDDETNLPADELGTEVDVNEVDTPLTGRPWLFTDVGANKWYHNAVMYAFDREWIDGVSDTAFAPEDNVKRSEMVALLWKYAGRPEVDAGDLSFTDVAEDQWYAKAVLWAVSNKLVSGRPDGTFAPNEYITRQDMATMMFNYFVRFIQDETWSENWKTATLDDFADGDKVASYAQEAMQWMTFHKVMSGDGVSLDPGALTIRAQVAMLLQNFDGATASGDHTV